MTEQYEKIAKELENTLNQFSENVNKILEEMFSLKGKTEKDWEMKIPYKYGDNNYCIQSSGDVFSSRWDGIEADNKYFSQGNIFLTKQAAELESKRRNLLTRCKAFRDECNDGWKPDWSNLDKKWEINYDTEAENFKTFWSCVTNSFSTFGYFKNEQDAQYAIKLFGEEIKELFVECD